jgi:hypothetical protein
MTMKNSFAMDMDESASVTSEAGDISLWQMKLTLDISVSYKIK